MYEWFDKANLSSPNLLKKMSFGELHLESHWTKMELFGITNQVRQWSNDDWRIESPFIQGMNWWTYINEKPPHQQKTSNGNGGISFPEISPWTSYLILEDPGGSNLFLLAIWSQKIPNKSCNPPADLTPSYHCSAGFPG